MSRRPSADAGGSASTLTDRYVWAVTRRLPEPQRDDVGQELRATIADTVQAKLADRDAASGGAAVAAAERSAVVDLGDPDVLAASYRGRPQVLVGAMLFPSYRRVLATLLIVVTPIAGAAAMAAQLVAGEDLLPALGSGVWIAVQAAVHIAFWVTVVFALLERSETRTPVEPWTPDQLPDVAAERRHDPVDAVVSIAVAVLLIGVLLWQRQASWFATDGGEPIPFLDPALWDVWMPLVLAIIAAGIGLDVVRVARGWTVPLAWVNAVLDLALLGVVGWLLSADQLVNDAFLGALQAQTGGPEAGTLVVGTVAAGVVITCLWDAVDGLRRAHR